MNKKLTLKDLFKIAKGEESDCCEREQNKQNCCSSKKTMRDCECTNEEHSCCQ